MTMIIASPDDSVEKVLKLFKRQVEKSGILRDVSKKEYYVKPSVAKLLKQRAARKRSAKERRNQFHNA